MDKCKKSQKLGMSFGKAGHILHKNILFNLVQKCDLDICYRCGKRIESKIHLSVEHKIAWLNSDKPKELFFDLDNIAFSHLKCNVDARDKTFYKKEEYKQKLSKACSHGNYPQSKLNEEKVKEIKLQLKQGIGILKIAKKFNVAHKVITFINQGKMWKYV